MNFLSFDLCLFWVSSLAYPNFLGKKGYVVVVDVDELSSFRIFLAKLFICNC